MGNANENETLVSIAIENNEFFLGSNRIDPIWLIIRTSRSCLNPSSYTLSEGTVIKIGRLQFRVKSMKAKEDSFEKITAETATEKDSCCRVCLCEGLSDENPLISLCKCAGTMKYIHIECLQQWMGSKITTTITENSVMKYIRSIHCELCKVKLPLTITANAVSYDLLKGQKFQVPYLILEGIASEFREPGVYFISFLNRCSVMLGRGHDSDVRIPDISVSRCHARITYANEQFTIQDNDSKFGTLVMLEGTQPITNQMAIQCGRTVMQFTKNPCPKGENIRFEWEKE
jgi:FHA domain/RING-variant domain